MLVVPNEARLAHEIPRFQFVLYRIEEGRMSQLSASFRPEFACQYRAMSSRCWKQFPSSRSRLFSGLLPLVESCALLWLFATKCSLEQAARARFTSWQDCPKVSKMRGIPAVPRGLIKASPQESSGFRVQSLRARFGQALVGTAGSFGSHISS